MTTFTIDNENQIMAYLSAEDANSNPQAQQFTSAKELARLAAKWPATRLVELWNSLPGQKPVKKLADRKAAVARIWAAIQSVAPDNLVFGPAGFRDAATHRRWQQMAADGVVFKKSGTVPMNHNDRGNRGAGAALALLAEAHVALSDVLFAYDRCTCPLSATH